MSDVESLKADYAKAVEEYRRAGDIFQEKGEALDKSQSALTARISEDEWAAFHSQVFRGSPTAEYYRTYP
jgi:hypothetical protein